MIRILSAYFPTRTVVLAVSETVLVFFALFLFVSVNRAEKPGLSVIDERELFQLAIVGFICLICLYYQNLYTPECTADFRPIFTRLIRGLGIAAILLAYIYLFFPAVALGSGLTALAILIIAVCLSLSRQAFVTLNKSGRWSTSTLVIGDGPLATYVLDAIQSRPELGLKLIGYLGQPSRAVSALADVQCLGQVEDLGEVISRTAVQNVIVALQDGRAKLPVETLLDLKSAGVAIQEGAEFYEFTTGKIPVDTLRPSWLIFGPGFRVSKVQAFYQRVFSFTLALLGLVMLLPVMTLIGLATWLDSPGPVIFRQTRIGMGGEPFTLYKFRTMYHEADQGRAPLPVQPNDRRVTRVGLWLRQFRLDEIPQLYNILVGQMSFVGPRPFVPNQEFALVQEIPLYKRRWAIRPGATGWAQVHRGYCATLDDNAEKLAYDLFYIKNMSIGLDLFILFKTIKIVLAGIGGR